MTATVEELRIHGVYAQAQEGKFMVRTKVPGGTLSGEQALCLCDIADRYATGKLHLTTRMSIEFHGVAETNLPSVLEELARAGLTSRGACGGAVRGVAVSTAFAPETSRVRELARRIHRHFTGNDAFEGLPKKFKVGVDGDYRTARHLIQDVGLVQTGETSFDVWLAGGLGRLPKAAFLFATGVPEEEIIPVIEATVQVYAARAPRGKRLKHVVAEIGEDGLQSLLRGELGERYPRGAEAPAPSSAEDVLPDSGDGWLLARVFTGELSTSGLRRLAALSERFAGGTLILTADQDVALELSDPTCRSAAARALSEAGFGEDTAEGQVVFRICPGSHECKLGLAPTRDVARALIAAMGPSARGLAWAISGCPNSCAQPQLADVGIVCARLGRREGSEPVPLYELLRRTDGALGAVVRERVPLEDLVSAARALG